MWDCYGLKLSCKRLAKLYFSQLQEIHGIGAGPFQLILCSDISFTICESNGKSKLQVEARLQNFKKLPCFVILTEKQWKEVTTSTSNIPPVNDSSDRPHGKHTQNRIKISMLRSMGIDKYLGNQLFFVGLCFLVSANPAIFEKSVS